MRYLLTLLLLIGISFGQKAVTAKENCESEKRIEVKKEIQDGKVLLSITKDGKTEEFTADMEDKDAIAKLEQKLEAYDVDKMKIHNKIIKHDCDKEDCNHEDCEHAENIRVIKKVKGKEAECERAELDKEDLVWHMNDDDGDIKIIKKYMDGDDFLLTDEKAGYLGVHIQDLTEQLGGHFKIKDGKGVLVSEVVEDSPAEKAGLKAGDVITKVDDKKVASASELSEAVRSYEPESKVTVSVVRDGKTKKLNAKLGEAENKLFAHHNFEMPEKMAEKHKMMFKMPAHPELEDFDFRDFEFDTQEFKADMEKLKKELEELKLQMKQLQKEK